MTVVTGPPGEGERDNRRRLLGMLGVAGPILFTLAWLAGWVAQEDDYSPRHEDISALAALDAQHAWIMIAGLLTVGICVSALALGLFGAIRDGLSARVGPAILLLVGLGFVTVGLMRNDCSSELEACAAKFKAGDVSWHHKAHDGISGVMFLLIIAAQLIFARAFRTDARWSSLRRFSLATGALTFALAVLFGAEIFDDSNGLVQRIFVAVPFLWLAVMGLRLVRNASPGGPSPGERTDTQSGALQTAPP